MAADTTRSMSLVPANCFVLAALSQLARQKTLGPDLAVQVLCPMCCLCTGSSAASAKIRAKIRVCVGAPVLSTARSVGHHCIVLVFRIA